MRGGSIATVQVTDFVRKMTQCGLAGCAVVAGVTYSVFLDWLIAISITERQIEYSWRKTIVAGFVAGFCLALISIH